MFLQYKLTRVILLVHGPTFGPGSTIRGRTLTLKAKYADFQRIIRSRTREFPFASQADFEELAFALLETLFPVAQGIRLLGVTLSSLGEENNESAEQLRLSI